MSSICPQRIIKEAIRIIEGLHDDELTSDEQEAIDNNLLELNELEKRLYRGGITRINSNGDIGPS